MAPPNNKFKRGTIVAHFDFPQYHYMVIRNYSRIRGFRKIQFVEIYDLVREEKNIEYYDNLYQHKLIVITDILIESCKPKRKTST